MSDVFVGRGHELDLLALELGAACAGTPRVVRVLGEAGIGKRALLAALLRGLEPKIPSRVVRADEDGRHVDFGLVGQLLPELPSLGQDALAVGASLLRWLGRAAERSPFLLVVDDAHPAVGINTMHASSEDQRTDEPSVRLALWLHGADAEPLRGTAFLAGVQAPALFEGVLDLRQLERAMASAHLDASQRIEDRDVD